MLVWDKHRSNQEENLIVKSAIDVQYKIRVIQNSKWECLQTLKFLIVQCQIRWKQHLTHFHGNVSSYFHLLYYMFTCVWYKKKSKLKIFHYNLKYIENWHLLNSNCALEVCKVVLQIVHKTDFLFFVVMLVTARHILLYKVSLLLVHLCETHKQFTQHQQTESSCYSWPRWCHYGKQNHLALYGRRKFGTCQVPLITDRLSI